MKMTYKVFNNPQREGMNARTHTLNTGQPKTEKKTIYVGTLMRIMNDTPEHNDIIKGRQKLGHTEHMGNENSSRV